MSKKESKSSSKPWAGLRGKLLPWLKAYLDDTNPDTFLNKTGASRAAGYKCNTKTGFGEIGYQNSIKLQPLINAWLDDHGLTRERNKKKLLQLSEAHEDKIINVKGKIEPESLPEFCELLFCAEQEKFDKDGGKIIEYQSTIAIKQVANETQRRTVDMMIKVLGQYAVETINVQADENLIALMQLGRKRAKEDDDE